MTKHERPIAAEIENFFVCVGAQKAGTTWLARVLASHPELFLTPVKEIHYFDHIAGITQHLSAKKRRSRFRKYLQKLATQWHRAGELAALRPWYRVYMRNPLDDEWYRALFSERAGARFAGEVTPEYAIVGKEGLEHLKKLAPSVRIIFILRNPVEQCWSQILHHCRSNRLNAAAMNDEVLKVLAGTERFKKLSDYERTLNELDEVFAPDQCLFLFYEDIHADRLAALEQICRFIGASFDPAHFTNLGARFNPSQKQEIPDTVRRHLQEAYRPMAETLAARFGRLPDAWISEFSL